MNRLNLPVLPCTVEFVGATHNLDSMLSLSPQPRDHRLVATIIRNFGPIITSPARAAFVAYASLVLMSFSSLLGQCEKLCQSAASRASPVDHDW